MPGASFLRVFCERVGFHEKARAWDLSETHQGARVNGGETGLVPTTKGIRPVLFSALGLDQEAARDGANMDNFQKITGHARGFVARTPSEVFVNTFLGNSHRAIIS